MTTSALSASAQVQSTPNRPRRDRKKGTGRTAQTKGVSLSQGELDDVRTVEDLGGMGLSEVYHRHFAPQMHAAAQLLLAASEAGVELNRRLIVDAWDVTVSADERAAVYAAPSSLVMGE
jgi:hypothetical protein